MSHNFSKSFIYSVYKHFYIILPLNNSYIFVQTESDAGITSQKYVAVV